MRADRPCWPPTRLLADGGRLTELAADTIAQLNEFLPAPLEPSESHRHLGDAERGTLCEGGGPRGQGSRHGRPAGDPGAHGVTDPTAIAEQLTTYAKLGGKPVIASWMGGSDVAAGEAILNQAGIPTYSYPDSAARVFQAMWRYSANLKALYETPKAIESETGNAHATELIASARAKGRTLLTEAESKKLLTAYDIPTVVTEIAASVDQAVETAARIGYPVVLKLHSETITHKTDVGGVQLDLPSGEAVRRAYRNIEESVTKAVGREHFLGVTVQPMVNPRCAPTATSSF